MNCQQKNSSSEKFYRQLLTTILIGLFLCCIFGMTNNAYALSEKNIKGACKADFNKWKKRGGFGAFAIGTNGYCGWSYDNSTISEARTSAFFYCRDGGKGKSCAVVSENGTIGTNGKRWADCLNGNADVAIGACTAIVNSANQTRPSIASAYNNRGIARNNKGQIDLAMADYTSAIKTDKAHGWAYSNRARIKYDRGEYESALVDFKAALKYYKSGGGDYRNYDQASIVTLQKLLSTIRSLSDEKLCGAALASSKQDWERSPRFISHVKEAKKRGISVDRCRALIPLPQPPQVSTIGTSPVGFIQNLPNSPLCGGALNPNKTAWETRAAWTGHVLEAQRRDFSIDQCRVVLGLRRQLDVTAIPAFLNPPKSGSAISALLQETPVDKLCGLALTRDKISWEVNTQWGVYVEEAKRRHLNVDECRQKLGLPVLPAALNAMSSALQNTSNEYICTFALNSRKTNWDPGFGISKEYTEAQRRGLGIGDCRAALGLPREIEVVTSLVQPEPSGLDGPAKTPPLPRPKPLEVLMAAAEKMVIEPALTQPLVTSPHKPLKSGFIEGPRVGSPTGKPVIATLDETKNWWPEQTSDVTTPSNVSSSGFNKNETKLPDNVQYPEIQSNDLLYRDRTASSGKEATNLVANTNSPGKDVSSATLGLRVCNNDSVRIRFALGYKDNADWVSKGWWTLIPGSCVSALPGQLSRRYFYLYAEDLDKGGSWGGKAMLCVQDSTFDIRSITDCAESGYQKVGFFEVDTAEEKSWTVSLSGQKIEPLPASPNISQATPLLPPAVSPPAEAQLTVPFGTRIALVIGNSTYRHVSRLENPDSDAELMTTTLQKAGFKVTKLIDADQSAMKKAMLEFGRELRGGADASLFYYSGHGVQVKAENYLIPVDASIRDEDEVGFQAIDVNAFLQTMDSSPSKVKIVVLDACRDNPFANQYRSTSRGLASVTAPSGTYIAYSTAPGSVAEDGDGKNSPYTKALAEFILRPGLKIEEAFKQTRIQVMKASSQKQVPWETTSLTGDFYFVPEPK